MTKTRRTFSDEFKREAVAQGLIGDGEPLEIGRRTGR